jgi:predicted anti-sigma-YlaC factor YlaD
MPQRSSPKPERVLDASVPVLVCASMLVACQGCALKRIALNSVANTLAASGDTFSSDEDPELVRDAVPFALKTYESLLASLPRHRGLLLATCSGFTQYSYAFVQSEADRLEPTDYAQSIVHRERALKLYLRGRDYCMRAIEIAHPGVVSRLNRNPAAALARFTTRDVALLYWTAASWGAAATLGLERPELVGDLPTVRSLVDRALALDERFGDGAIHEILISLESVPEAMGGSEARARTHFDRAVLLCGGQCAGAYVTLATSLALGAQDRAEFTTLLEQALAVDPGAVKSRRLANLIAQRRARNLLARVDDLFVPDQEVKQP